MSRKVITLLLLVLLTIVACSKKPIRTEFDDKQIIDLMTSEFKKGITLDGSTIYYWPSDMRIVDKSPLTQNKELPIKVYMKGARVTTKDIVKKPLAAPPANGQITEGTDLFYVSINTSGKMKITFFDKSPLVDPT